MWRLELKTFRRSSIAVFDVLECVRPSGMKVYRMAYRTTLFFITIILCFLGAAGFPAPGFTQECVRILLIPDDATITFKSSVKISASSPGVFCTLDPSQHYLLSIGKTGYETRECGASFLWDRQRMNFSSRRMGHVARSLVLPGWGQFARGEHWRGTEAFLGSAALGVVWYQAYRNYVDEKDRYDFFLSASDDAAREADKIRYQMQERISARLTNAQRRYVLEVSALCGWMYAGNLIETFLLAAPPRVASVEGFNATLEIPRKSKARSVMRSFFFPGLGQKYLGKSAKGFFFQTVFITTAAFTLKARKDYDIATIDYELAREALENAETQGQLEEAREAVSLRWDERRDQERERNALYIILASLWALNVLDVSISGGDAAPGGRIGFDTSVSPSGLHTGIRIGF